MSGWSDPSTYTGQAAGLLIALGVLWRCYKLMEDQRKEYRQDQKEKDLANQANIDKLNAEHRNEIKDMRTDFKETMALVVNKFDASEKMQEERYKEMLDRKFSKDPYGGN